MKRYALFFTLIVTVAVAGSISGNKPFSNSDVAWLLKPSTSGETITPSQSGIGWADGRYTLQTPAGALQIYETGTPAEATIYWPGKILTDAMEAGDITGDLTGNQITSGIIPGTVMNASMPVPFISFVDSATGAGTAGGLTYANTGPGSQSEPATPGSYFAAINVTDGGTGARNALEGKIYTHSQMAVTRVVSVPATAESTGTAGDVAYNSTHFYICTATNTWRRVAIASW